jgi:hypothetical protein
LRAAGWPVARKCRLRRCPAKSSFRGTWVQCGRRVPHFQWSRWDEPAPVTIFLIGTIAPRPKDRPHGSRIISVRRQ